MWRRRRRSGGVQNLPAAGASELLTSEGAGGVIRITVDDANAVYPVTIDPLATSPNWTAESDQATARFGCSVGTAGDVNGDGYAEVIVGAYRYDNGQTEEGWAFVYYGNRGAGLSLNPRQQRSGAVVG